MKHTAQIQKEFIRRAKHNSKFTESFWQSLSPDIQREYLRQHPKSKKHLTSHNLDLLSPEAQDIRAPDKIKYKGKKYLSLKVVYDMLNKLGEKILGSNDILDQPRDPLVANSKSSKH